MKLGGYGFYTTTNKNQAVSFAEKVVRIRKEGNPIVNIYHIDEQQTLTQLKLLRFENADERWLDFVSANRAGEYQGQQYDLVYGPVADDDVYRTFTLYTAGVLTREQTIETLKIKKLYDQLVLATYRALDFLEFQGIMEWEGQNGR